VLADARKEELTYARNGEERLYSTTRGIESAYLAAHERLEPPQ
jgi:hypothetical protein